MRMGMVRSAAVLVVLVCACWCRLSDAHGLLLEPPSRNWKAYVNPPTIEQRFDYAHGLTAGGKLKVSDNCKYTWPAGVHGMCGDPAGESRWMQPTQPSRTYKAGSIVGLQVIVQTNHAGRFDFSLCPATATDASSCRRLERADGRGQHFYLPRIRAFNGGATGDDAMPTERGPISSWSWFSMPGIDCGVGRVCNQFTGNVVYEVKYRLPTDFTCSSCILQWHWLTGHSCWPPCSQEDPTYPNCRAPTYQLPYCGTPGASYPEEYWNCADVTITA